jgi:peptide/nickel transport system substrate-binding protein
MPVSPHAPPGRREILLGALGAGLAAAAGRLGPVAAAEAAAPKPGGHLRLAVTGGSVTDVLDPAAISNYFTFLINWASRNCLVEVDANGTAQPELAESWSASTDAATWTFRLRRGVEFHNGKAFTAQDVVWSISRHLGKRSRSAVKSIVEQIIGMRADGLNTVVFSLKSGDMDFPYILSDQHLTIVPEGTEGDELDMGVGTGGYLLKEWQPGVRGRLVKQQNYWKPGRAHFEAVDILNVEDVAARTTALLSGQVDFIANPDLKTIDRLEAVRGIQVIETLSNSYVSMPMLTDTPPFTDNDVRLAFKYAIDREELVQKILYGHGTVGNDQPINETYPLFAKDLPQRSYDPERARFHLRRAGMDGLKIDLSAADAPFNGAVDSALLYAATAAKAGIQIRVVREPADGYWDNVWRRKPFCMSHWNGRSTQAWLFSIAYASGGGWNETRWANDPFDKLLSALRIERDPDRRAEMSRDMQMLVRDECGDVIPAFDNCVMAASSKLNFGKLASNWVLDGYRLPERWWFD